MAKRALISVSDKAGIEQFAKELASLGFTIISTGGTSSALNASGVATTDVQDITGFPECLDGRVKTLHPAIHGGLLAMRSKESHMAQIHEHGIQPIDILVINLYPFKKTVQKPGAKFSEAIENIDIGGPAMIRSAAKNYQDVTVIVDPDDYARVISALKDGGKPPVPLNFELARKAFEHTANYDAMIAGYLAAFSASDFACGGDGDGGGGGDSGGSGDGGGSDVGDAAGDTGAADGVGGGGGGESEPQGPRFPEKLTFTFEKVQQMRYGENPHQASAFYSDPFPPAGSLATYKQLHGKELSYNNIGDLDGALSLLAEFDEPAAVAVKHATPCGAAVAANIYEAYLKAYESDKTSIFGGIVAVNRVIDAATAAEMGKIFLEIIAAPGYDEDAFIILSKKKNIRLLAVDTPAAARERSAGSFFIKKVGGGLLVQTNDDSVVDRSIIKTVTDKSPTEGELDDMCFAMAVVKHTKSNAIVLAKDFATIGVGPGQTSRIMATKIAIEIAGDRAVSSVAASEALFPLDDCVEALAAAGVTAIMQPGGSINDQASIDACNRHGIAMVFTGIRHFKH